MRALRTNLTRNFVLLLAAATTAHAETKTFSPEASRVEEAARKAAAAGGTLFPVGPSETVSISFVKLGDEPWKMGILQKMRVNAPLERLVRALDDTDAYVGIFDGLKKSEHREAKSPDDFTLFTETEIPLPFVPNDKTSMRYKIERKPLSVLYRFDLTEGNHLDAYDGVGLAAADGPHSSIYWELDLLEPSFGMSRALPVKQFWTGNAASSLQSDWALKLKAEDRAAKPASILADSQKRADAAKDKLDEAYASPAASLESLLAAATPASPSNSASPKNPLSPAPSTTKPKHKGPSSDPNP